MAVIGCDAVLLYGLIVGGCGIAFVVVPTVLGILFVETQHQLVAMGLGQYAGGRYRHVLCIAAHKALIGQGGLVVEFVAVD